MNLRMNGLKLAAGAALLGTSFVFGAAGTAYAQGDHTHDWEDQNHQKREKKAEKRHQKREKEALKEHQRQERDYYGNDADLRDHQRREREAVKQHQRNEERNRRARQRNERGGYSNDGYYGNDGYGDSGINRQVFDRGYNEGLRAGRNDRSRNRQYRYEDHSAYRNAEGGYGSRNSDGESFREGFRRGYDEGYRSNRNSGNGGGWGNILGGILGRP